MKAGMRVGLEGWMDASIQQKGLDETNVGTRTGSECGLVVADSLELEPCCRIES